MSHPFHHAISSARRHGGSAEEYVSLHSWFDASKSVHADFRHRALRHHVEGIALARRLFGDTLSTSTGAVSIETLGAQHLDEDLGSQVSVADWFSQLMAEPWMLGREVPVPVHVRESIRKWGGEPNDYVRVHAFFDAVEQPQLNAAQRRALHHHAEGIFLAEAVFGVTITTSTGRQLPTRWIGEQHVKREFGRIPSAGEWLQAINPAAWMSPRAPRELREIIAE
jgi:hypothetical protein